MGEIKNHTFFAKKRTINTKTKRNLEVFADVNADIRTTKLYGDGPYYKITIREANEGEEPSLWGWKDFARKEYLMIYAVKEAVESCFPYGYEIEEKRGKGKLLGLVIETNIEVE